MKARQTRVSTPCIGPITTGAKRTVDARATRSRICRSNSASQDCFTASRQRKQLTRVEQHHAMRLPAATVGRLKNRDERVRLNHLSSLAFQGELLRRQLNDVAEVSPVGPSGLQFHENDASIRQSVGSIKPGDQRDRASRAKLLLHVHEPGSLQLTWSGSEFPSAEATPSAPRKQDSRDEREHQHPKYRRHPASLLPTACPHRCERSASTRRVNLRSSALRSRIQQAVGPML